MGVPMPLHFYMTPGSCSTGIHILLEELELPFQVTVLNLPAGQHREPAYLAINPKGTIPALVLNDGQALTEFQAIAYWLARSYPRRQWLSEEPALAARTLAFMEHVVGHLHGQGYTRIFTTDTYLPPGVMQDLPAQERARWTAAVQARGREIVTQGFAVIELQLTDGGWAMGEHFGLADAAFFYVAFWADKLSLPLPPRCQALYRRLRDRPVVARVLAEEGYR
jgi:glutathione S-transferase